MEIQRAGDKPHPLEELWLDREWRLQSWSVVLVFALAKLAIDYQLGWLRIAAFVIAAALSGYLLMGAMFIAAVLAQLPGYALHRLRRSRS